MKNEPTLKHEFVEFIPETLANSVIYVSIPYATASHKCICGCGNIVVTPLSPTDWKMTFDGETISLDPSIGNWSFKCKSHYWIKRNKILLAPQWSKEEIHEGRAFDREAKDKFYGPGSAGTQSKKAAKKKNKKPSLKWLSKFQKLW
jgi:hypothetical protein